MRGHLYAVDWKNRGLCVSGKTPSTIRSQKAYGKFPHFKSAKPTSTFLTGALGEAGDPVSYGKMLPRHLTSTRQPPLSRKLILLLLLMAGIHPNPGPSSSSSLVVMHWNCNGLKNSSAELGRFLQKYNVGICCLQETKLRDGDLHPPDFPGYLLHRQDRLRHGGGGLAILIRLNIPFINADTSAILANDDFTELQAITLFPDTSPLTIVNAYIPPASSTNNQVVDFASLLAFPSSNFLIVGDLNAHHGQWFSGVAADARGNALADSIVNSSAVCLNEDTHTRRSPSISQSNSSPDISLVSAHLAPSASWSTVDSLNSDHLPVLVRFADCETPPPRSRKSFINFRRANWNGFREELENLVAALPTPSSCMQGEKCLREAVLTASKHNIPSGYRPVFTPAFPEAAVPLAEERDRLRGANPHNPEVSRLNEEISGLVVEERRARYKEFLEKANPR